MGGVVECRQQVGSDALGEGEDCAVELDSSLCAGDLEMNFFGLDDRAFITFIEPSPIPLREAIDLNRPTDLTLPPLEPKWMSRSATEDRVETDFVFEGDGNYTDYCRSTAEELASNRLYESVCDQTHVES